MITPEELDYIRTAAIGAGRNRAARGRGCMNNAREKEG